VTADYGGIRHNYRGSTLKSLWPSKRKPRGKKAQERSQAVKKLLQGRARLKRPARQSETGLVKNSLVNNINARKKKGISRSKKKQTVDKESYDHMEEGWK
jgi:hypothetical protein